MSNNVLRPLLAAMPWFLSMLISAHAGVLTPCAEAPGLKPGAAPVAQSSVNFGPYNMSTLEGGIGLSRALAPDVALADPGAPWSLSGWMRLTRPQSGMVVVAALGNTSARSDGWRGVALLDGELALELTPTITLRGGALLEAGRWYQFAATFDGSTARLYLDGRELAAVAATTTRVAPCFDIAPVPGDPTARRAMHFGGELAQLALASDALDAPTVKALAAARPNFSLITFDAVGVGWPLQEHAWRGLLEPQDPWTLPRSRSAQGALEPAPQALSGDAPQALSGDAAAIGVLSPRAPGVWALEGWRLRAAPDIAADGAELSQPGYRESQWYDAIVPGTVLSTLIARGVYPDPDYGLNNLAIPDALSRQDYWYRSVFFAPADLRDRQTTITFGGINYAAEVWVNGARIGSIKGAFVRGIFDLSGVLRAGRPNAVAVRISPPPHPGIPHEQSIAAGPGENGGMLALDGPTFIASEGWDWIPGIRDRDAGIWQDVELRATGALRLLDPQVVTHLPLPLTDSADITIAVPVENKRPAPVRAALIARLGAISLRKELTLPQGLTTVVLSRAEFPQLHLNDPHLWWPNGYGAPSLYSLELELDEGAATSDRATMKFGIRELTYELSLFDHEGRLRRVEVDPALGTLLGERLVDVSHAAIKRTPQGWAASLTAAGESSAAVRPASNASLTPYLVIKVNGVPIAARGGSWGMDDSRKRISRARLEPFFKLHRDANLNIVRNWLGQNTEEVFYELADEYGLLVLNDFWESTQDFQLEAQDPALFLENARDVISRYRNHPSIALWFGRNEGVPQPILNEGLAQLVAALDGTRYYTGSSNEINLQHSGPYNYRPPGQYFTELARGFSVEVGTPSLSTLESLRASIPPADRWPLSDTYAYHDWHFGGNGDVATFMAAMSAEYGAARSLEDFERKAQLMNYVSYRAIFEGFAAHLWSQNSGRLLWMSHPAWPSNTWQIYSSDYDTGAAYYAVKKACEPIHAQLDLPDYRLAVVNTTRLDRPALTLRTRVLSIDGRTLSERADLLDAGANAVVTAPAPLQLDSLLEREGLVLVKLTLSDAGGILSDNLYWQGRDDAAQQKLNSMTRQPLAVSARAGAAAGDGRIDITLENRGNAPALNAKLTMLDSEGVRVLPVYYSDNYLSLLPGEVRKIEVHCPPAGVRCSRVAIRGWNVEEREIGVAQR
jgi:hypothetical protein